MKDQILKGYWVVGTDTDVGKTVFSSMLVTAMNGSYWKPVQSGLLDGTDTDFVRTVSELDSGHFIPEIYRLTQPLSPHLSAAIDGKTIDLDHFHWPDSSVIKNNFLVMEGAGGVMVPINGSELIVDLMHRLPAPTIIVCRSTLGTINHTLLTVEALKSRNIPIAGFVMNGPKNTDNEKSVRDFTGITHLGSIPPLKQINREELLHVWDGQGFASHFAQ